MLTRWRHPAAFVLVVAYAVVIAAAVGWQVYKAPKIGNDTAKLGHDIWATLTITQTLGWIFLGPILTSGAIAAERERGLLDGLLLSHLTAREIVNGKMLGALSLVVLLLLVPLPAIALCFLLGGVSPAEFWASLVLNFGTALSGLGFGIAASAGSKNSGIALGQALLRASIAQVLMAIPICCCVPLSPIIASLYLVQASIDAPNWLCLVYLLMHYAIARRQLQSAAQAATKALPEPILGYQTDHYGQTAPLQESVRTGEWSAGVPPAFWAYTAGGTPALQTYAIAYPDSFPVASPSRNRLRAPLLCDFANPILQREAQKRLRFRWSDNNATNDLLLTVTLIGFSIYFLPLTLMAWFEPTRSKELWWMVSYPWLVLTTIAATLTAASTFTRERESGHWPFLWLTPLSHGEIIGGKLGGVLIGIAYWSLLMVPFWLACALRLPLLLLVPTLMLTVGAVWLGANIGLFFSALCKKSSAALNWTIIALFAWWLWHPPWQNWQTLGAGAHFWHALILFCGGELLYLATHRILRRAPYED